MPRSGLQMRCQRARKQGSPQIHSWKQGVISVVLPQGVNPEKLCTGQECGFSWCMTRTHQCHSSCTSQFLPGTAFPGKLCTTKGVQQKNPAVVSAPGWECCELSSWLSLFYYLKDREQIRENELQIMTNSTSSPNICSHNHAETLKPCRGFQRCS